LGNKLHGNSCYSTKRSRSRFRAISFPPLRPPLVRPGNQNQVLNLQRASFLCGVFCYYLRSLSRRTDLAPGRHFACLIGRLGGDNRETSTGPSLSCHPLSSLSPIHDHFIHLQQSSSRSLPPGILPPITTKWPTFIMGSRRRPNQIRREIDYRRCSRC
jgi:hypothetical protein